MGILLASVHENQRVTDVYIIASQPRIGEDLVIQSRER